MSLFHTLTISGSRNSSKPRMGSRSLADRGPVSPLRSVDNPDRCCCCCCCFSRLFLLLLLELCHALVVRLRRVAVAGAPTAEVRVEKDENSDEQEVVVTSGRRAVKARRTSEATPLCIDVMTVSSRTSSQLVCTLRLGKNHGASRGGGGDINESQRPQNAAALPRWLAGQACSSCACRVFERSRW